MHLSYVSLNTFLLEYEIRNEILQYYDNKISIFIVVLFMLTINERSKPQTV